MRATHAAPTHSPRARTICDALDAHAACSVVLLYGSLARGDAVDTSDIDVVGFTAASIVDGHLCATGDIDGRPLDGWIYPESKLDEAGTAWLHLADARVLRDSGDRGAALITRARAALSAGLCLAPDKRAQHVAWIDKMCTRMRRGDLDADFRRLWLLTELLRFWFELRGMHYLGPKRSLAHLAAERPDAHALFQAAYRAPHNNHAVDALAEHVRDV